jgi:predicted PurR-regulated permease PerM
MTRSLNRKGELLAFAQRVLVATLVVASVLLVLLLLWYAADLLMLVFAGVLISILLRTFSEFLVKKTGLNYGLSLALASLVLVAFIVAASWLVMDRLIDQFKQLQLLLPQAVQNFKGYIGQYEWGRNAIDSLPSFSDWVAQRGGTVVSQLTGLASSTFGAIVNILVVFIIGIYLASQPDLYARGLNHLVPYGYRERFGEILSVIDDALRRWLLGRFGLMIINGLLTAIALWILRVPLAFTLGLLAGILNFVPNFGPWIAAIPAVLIAFMQSPRQGVSVAVLYLLLQSLDGYLLTPLVDRRSVELPPVLTITAQVLLGIAFGFVGILLASPLTAVAMILVKMLYVEDLLGDRVLFELEKEVEKEREEEIRGSPRLE